jgi:RNA polymerase sigma factor (sigma-70 family)
MSPEGLDQALVEDAQAGSAGAFARLVERHQQALRAFLRRTCGDWAQADDLAQETFLTAWSRIGRLEAGDSVRAWLCGIGYNKHLTALRSRARPRVTCDFTVPNGRLRASAASAWLKSAARHRATQARWSGGRPAMAVSSVIRSSLMAGAGTARSAS